jgi:multidrug efflux system outer membrane protein
MRSHRDLAAALAVAVAASACSLAPAYHRPAAPVPANVASAPRADAAASTPGSTAAAADALGWREVLGDPRLQALVTLALERNRDLRVAALNVEATRAQFGIQRAQRLPQLSAGASLSRQRIPEDLNTSGKAVIADTWQVGGALATFELDLFGRVKSLSDAALEQYLATEEAARSARLGLVAAVATQYLASLAAEEQVALARETLASQEASHRLTTRAAEAGRTTELDLRTSEAQLETARVNLAAAELSRARAANALTLLVGGPLPADLPPGLPLDGAQLVVELPAGVPSEVLVRRPDVLAAERALRSANATIGAARAAFFPSITLTASGGTSSATLDGLFGAGSTSWAFSPRLNLPIFNGGALRASLDLAEVRTSQEVARYERAIQGAFREVADGLEGRAWLEAQRAAQAARVAAETRRYQLSELRYRGGLDSYLTLLTAQRDLYAARSQLIQVRLARLTNLVDLYKALGGGWRERGEGAAAAPGAIQ